MAIDSNFSRLGESYRAVDLVSSGVRTPVLLAGAHVRTYVDNPQTLTVTSSAQALTVPSGATFADIYCEGTASTDFVRFWHGSTNPTASVGQKLKDHEVIASADPSTFSVILGTGSGTCTLRVEFYKYA